MTCQNSILIVIKMYPHIYFTVMWNVYIHQLLGVGYISQPCMVKERRVGSVANIYCRGLEYPKFKIVPFSLISCSLHKPNQLNLISPHSPVQPTCYSKFILACFPKKEDTVWPWFFKLVMDRIEKFECRREIGTFPTREWICGGWDKSDKRFLSSTTSGFAYNLRITYLFFLKEEIYFCLLKLYRKLHC